MRRRINTQFLKGLKQHAAKLKTGRKVARDFYLDENGPKGFGVVNTDKSKVTFVVQRRWPGSVVPVRRIIGEFPAIGYAEARAIAGEWTHKADNGIDPEAERKKAAAAAEADRRRIELEHSKLLPFDTLLADYVREDLRGKRRAIRDEQELRRHVLPQWTGLPVAQINQGHVLELAKTLRDKPATGRLVLSHIKRVFIFASHEANSKKGNRYGLLFNPAIGVKPQRVFGKKRSRDRFLSDEELVAALRVLRRIDTPDARVLQLILFSGLRLTEASELRWDEVNLKERLIDLPPERTKNGHRFLLPLVDETVALLRELEKARGDGPFVFSYPEENGFTAVNGWSRFKTTKLWPEFIKELGHDAPSWSAHTLRHTFLTTLRRLRVDSAVAEASLKSCEAGQHQVLRSLGLPA